MSHSARAGRVSRLLLARFAQATAAERETPAGCPQRRPAWPRQERCVHAEAELRHGLTAAFVRAGHFPQEARPARRLPALAAAGRACRVLRDRPRLPQGPEALGRAALGGVAGLARDEGLRGVHLRRIRDADLFEDRSQVLAERVARLLGLPDVHDAESARAV